MTFSEVKIRCSVYVSERKDQLEPNILMYLVGRGGEGCSSRVRPLDESAEIGVQYEYISLLVINNWSRRRNHMMHKKGECSLQSWRFYFNLLFVFSHDIQDRMDSSSTLSLCSYLLSVCLCVLLLNLVFIFTISSGVVSYLQELCAKFCLHCFP